MRLVVVDEDAGVFRSSNYDSHLVGTFAAGVTVAIPPLLSSTYHAETTTPLALLIQAPTPPGHTTPNVQESGCLAVSWQMHRATHYGDRKLV